MVNSPLIRPYLLGGSGGTLDSHDIIRAAISWGPRMVFGGGQV